MNIEKIKEEAQRVSEIKPVKFDELTEIVSKHILLSDPYILKILVAAVIANKLPCDPVWIFLVGPSGGGKTMFLDMLRDMREIYPLSNLTPNTFISGQQHTQGLLWEIDKKILIFKDFTTILQLYQESRNEIMSQLREIYDGAYKKAFGTGQAKGWTGKVGFIAGVTAHIDVTSQLYSSLGERFIQYRLITPEREDVGMYALNNSSRKRSTQDNARIEMRKAFEACVRGAEQYIEEDIEMNLDDDQKKKLVKIANFTTLSRSPVMRDSGPGREVYYKPTSEMPTRFTQQLNLLAITLMLINKANGYAQALLPEDEDLIYKIALDSIPMMRRTMLQKLAEFTTTTTTVVATLTNYPTSTTRRILEDLNVLGIIDRKKDKKNDYWQIKDEFQSLLIKYDHITPLTETQKLAMEADALEKSLEDDQLIPDYPYDNQ